MFFSFFSRSRSAGGLRRALRSRAGAKSRLRLSDFGGLGRQRLGAGRGGSRPGGARDDACKRRRARRSGAGAGAARHGRRSGKGREGGVRVWRVDEVGVGRRGGAEACWAGRLGCARRFEPKRAADRRGVLRGAVRIHCTAGLLHVCRWAGKRSGKGRSGRGEGGGASGGGSGLRAKAGAVERLLQRRRKRRRGTRKRSARTIAHARHADVGGWRWGRGG